MKKQFLLFVFFQVYSIIFAQNFDIQRLKDVSVYLGRSVENIPNSYIQDSDNELLYRKKLSNEITEGFIVNDGNIISVITWYYKQNNHSLLILNYNELLEYIKKEIGNPLMSTNNSTIWNWENNVLNVSIEGDELYEVSITTPEMAGLSQERWGNLIEKNKQRKTIYNFWNIPFGISLEKLVILISEKEEMVQYKDDLRDEIENSKNIVWHTPLRVGGKEGIMFDGFFANIITFIPHIEKLYRIIIEFPNYSECRFFYDEFVKENGIPDTIYGAVYRWNFNDNSFITFDHATYIVVYNDNRFFR
jgi:hypothetical protein